MLRFFSKFLTVVFVLLMGALGASAQWISYPDTLHKKRLKSVLIAQGSVWGVSMIGLSQIWYSDHNTGGFHSFDDHDEWLQMDKVGHTMTAYYLSQVGYESYRWSGVNNKKAAWGGAALSFSYLLGIELLDGMSEGWGFSWTDLAANTTGALLFTGQQLAWKEQRIQLKYSYHQTIYPDYRPDLLGSSWNEKMLKDYNGQTYWASFNLNSFGGQKLPRWLNVAVGYGADGMIGGTSNPEISDEGILLPPFERRRQFYLSPDIDLTRIPTRKKWLKYTLTLLSFIKVPAPAIEVDSKGNWQGHFLYF